MNPNSQITADQARSLINCKGSFGEALHRNGIFAPSSKSGIMTIEFMQGVKNRSIFCPRYDDVRLRPCPTPPARKVVQDFLIDCIRGGCMNMDPQNSAPYLKLQ